MNKLHDDIQNDYYFGLSRENEKPKKIADVNPYTVEDTMPIQKVSYSTEEALLMHKPILDFYFFLAHGENINSNHNYYPIQTDFAAITMYSMPYELYRDPLSELFKQNNSQYVCRLIYGACPKIPIVNKDTGKKIVYLPPLIFSGEEKYGNTYFKEHMGLYHFKISKEDYITGSYSEKLPICKVRKSRKIMTNDDLIRFNNITYTTIFEWIESDCKAEGIDSNSIMLGIMSCQVYQGKELDYDDIKTIIPKNVEVTSQNEFINSLTNIPDNKYISLKIKITNFGDNKWNPEELNKKTSDTVYYQCGPWYMFLESAGFINSEDIKSKIVCSRNTKEFNIFKLIDYMYISFKKSQYITVRFPIISGLNILFNFINNYYNNSPYIVMFTPIFKKEWQGGIGSNMISLLGRDSGKLYYICFSLLYEKYYENTEFLEFGNEYIEKNINKLMTIPESKEGYDWSLANYDYIDLLFTINDAREFVNRPKYSVQHFANLLQMQNGVIISEETCYTAEPISKVNPSIIHTTQSINQRTNLDDLNEVLSKRGGKKIKRKNKKSRKKNISKKNYTRKKTLKNKKQLGGNNELDDFEKLMLEIDRKNDVKSKLILNNI